MRRPALGCTGSPPPPTHACELFPSYYLCRVLTQMGQRNTCSARVCQMFLFRWVTPTPEGPRSAKRLLDNDMFGCGFCVSGHFSHGQSVSIVAQTNSTTRVVVDNGSVQGCVFVCKFCGLKDRRLISLLLKKFTQTTHNFSRNASQALKTTRFTPDKQVSLSAASVHFS